MNKKYITTSLLLAVLASGKPLSVIGTPIKKVSIENHLLIWRKTFLLEEHTIAEKKTDLQHQSAEI